MVEQVRTADDEDRGGGLVRILEYMSLRQVDQRELVMRFCRQDDAAVGALLDSCLATRRSDALALGEAVLVERGLEGLDAWIESALRRPRGSRWLVDALGEVADPHATRILLRLLDHPEASLRRRAADGLAGHRGHLDLRAFVRMLAEPLVRGQSRPDPFSAVRALHRLADPALEPDFGTDAAKRAERVLINCVRHETRGGVRGDAIAALGEIGSRRAVGCLVDALHREDEHHHRDVVIALRKIHPDRALIALLGLLQSRDPIIREEAANALGEIGDPKAVRRLRDLLGDPNPDVRQEAVLALGKLGGPTVLDALEHALADEGGLVRDALADLDSLTQDPAKLTPAFRLAILMTVLSLAPALVMMTTCFVRVVVVLTLLRQAIGVQTVPPSQVLVALSLFLTIFVMQPTFDRAYSAGIGPFLRGEIADDQAFAATAAPLREYMLRQTRAEDLLLFEDISNRPLPDNPEEVGLSVLTPAFMLSELRTAFLIGFMLFLPFLVIDMVVASTLLSMGMIVVPPVMISLPLKLMVFVLVDGWNLIIGALVRGIL